MSTRKCSKCGWEYPREWRGRTCRFCHEPFVGGFCNVCGEWYDVLPRRRCTKCNTVINNEWRHARIQKSAKALDDWLARIKEQPVQALTEEQWMKACRHFGGCAYCGSPEIDARSMFISFKDGGRYCAWNIIPACERCETACKVTANPFERMDEKVKRQQTCQTKKYGFTLENLQKIVDYLQDNMEVNQ